jgi:tol-pal system-associated acyl-CoA thioesterase
MSAPFPSANALSPSSGRFIEGVHHFPVRIYFEDTDAGGIVYHANYLRYMERARSDMLRLLGIDQRASIETGEGVYAVTRVEIEYRAPAKLDDDLIVVSRMERVSGATVLATIGSTAPFVGLFGTVWGIMNAFIGISESKTTSLAVVAPGIAEALLATALGLLTAIPAVIFYNKLSADANRITGGYEAFADEFATILSRQLDS